MQNLQMLYALFLIFTPQPQNTRALLIYSQVWLPLYNLYPGEIASPICKMTKWLTAHSLARWHTLDILNIPLALRHANTRLISLAIGFTLTYLLWFTWSTTTTITKTNILIYSYSFTILSFYFNYQILINHSIQEQYHSYIYSLTLQQFNWIIKYLKTTWIKNPGSVQSFQLIFKFKFYLLTYTSYSILPLYQ